MSKSKNKYVYLITILFVLLAAAAITTIIALKKQGNQPKKVEYTAVSAEKFMMDTFVKQTTYDQSADAKQKLEDMFSYLTEFEKKVSMHLSDSEISKVNNSAGVSAVAVSDETYQLLKRSKELSQQKNGIFDITIGPLVKLWGITSDSPRVPEDSEIKNYLKRVGISKLSLNDEKKTAKLTNPYMEIDLGGIAKGYACDLAKKKYQELGLDSGLISLGGNVYSFGTKPDGTAFIIGLRDPRGEDNDLMGNLTAPGKVVATTGDYERYFEQDGKRYHHVLDPKTGYPAQTDLIAVTIIAEEGALADFLSTTFFIAGKEAVLKNLDNDKFDIIAVDKEMKVYVSEGMKRNFQLTNKENYQLAE